MNAEAVHMCTYITFTKLLPLLFVYNQQTGVHCEVIRVNTWCDVHCSQMFPDLSYWPFVHVNLAAPSPGVRERGWEARRRDVETQDTSDCDSSDSSQSSSHESAVKTLQFRANTMKIQRNIRLFNFSLFPVFLPFYVLPRRRLLPACLLFVRSAGVLLVLSEANKKPSFNLAFLVLFLTVLYYYVFRISVSMFIDWEFVRFQSVANLTSLNKFISFYSHLIYSYYLHVWFDITTGVFILLYLLILSSLIFSL